MQTGQAQAGEVLISLHENEDPVFGIDVVPFLATSYRRRQKAVAGLEAGGREEARRAGPDGAVLGGVAAAGHFLRKSEINSVADMKGLKWRAYNAGTSRIAEIVGAQPVTIQAAELPQALATGVVNAFMTSSATGYDSKVWESLSYYYDTQAWLPKNITFVNKAAFDALDKPTQDAVLKAAAAAEDARLENVAGQDRLVRGPTQGEQMKVLPPSDKLKADLKKIGDQLTADWLKRAGADGEAVIEAYKKM